MPAIGVGHAVLAVLIAFMAFAFFSCSTGPSVAYGALGGGAAHSSQCGGSRNAASQGNVSQGGTVHGGVPEAIMGTGSMDEARLVSFFMENNRTADSGRVRRIAAHYIETSRAEGVNADIAFIQMCLETGFLRYGGLVTAEMNNFCGLGSTGPGHPGVAFGDERTGVLAHVQHLKGYASHTPLALPAADPRYRYINPKGKAPTIARLSGTWAADRSYGAKLRALLAKLYG